MIWKQVFADVIGLPVYTPVNPVEAPLGDAFMAAYADGTTSDFKDIAAWIEFNKPVLPNMKKNKQYKEYYAIYKELYVDLKNTMQKRTNILN